jgi:hypothetical protein
MTVVQKVIYFYKDKIRSTKMRTLLKEIIHCRNGLHPGEGGNEGEINEFEEEFLKFIIPQKRIWV